MTIDELFPNPTVKQVIFQIRFPNLFFLAERIGAFQIKVMKRFPKTSQLVRRPLFFTDQADQENLAELAQEARSEGAKQIWQFRSEEGVQLNVATDSLSLESTSHKTYQLGEAGRFRDEIEFACQHFFEITGIPLLNRVGLRYIDDCPVPEDLAQFGAYYATAFPLSRFALEQSHETDFKTVVERGEYRLRYVESMQQKKKGRMLILDFDAWAEDIEAERILDVTDQLHDIISAEFQNTIKEPVYEYMRQPKEKTNVAD